MVLSAYETFMNLLASHRIFNNFIIGAQFKPLLKPNKIANVVSKLCTKYPQFSLTVGKGYHSEYLKKYDVKDCIEIVHNSTPNQILDKYSALNFDYANKTPLWKLILDSKSNTLFFVADHTFLDGTAVKNVYNEICKSFDEVEDDKIENSVIVPEFKPYPTSAEILKFEERFAEEGIVVDKGTFPEMDEELLKLPYSKHNFNIVHLSKEKSNYLRQLCRDNGFKLTGLMFSIASKAIVDSYVHNEEFEKLRTLIAVNNRFKISPEVDPMLYQLGLFFGIHTHYDDISYVKNSSIFEIAKNFQNGLNDNKHRCNEFWEILETQAKNDRSVIEKSIEGFKNKDGTPGTTLTMSNINVLGDDKIGKVYFDEPMFDSAFGLHMVSSVDGMALNFTSHRAVPKEIFNNYVNNGLKCINSI